MGDQPDSLMLVMLRRLDAKMDRVVDDLADLKRRMTSLESQLGHQVATEQSHSAATMARLDRIDDRLDRIKGRLELQEVMT